LLGLTSATAHTLASGKGRPVAPIAEPSIPAVTVDDERTRVAQSPWPKSEMDFDKS
jgi:hypothetical protein